MNEHTTSKDWIISIVDDEIDGSELFQDALSSNIEGVSVVSFNDPVIALEHYTNNKKNYALVISDLRMPNLNGLELLFSVKKLNPNVRTALITAHNLDNDIVFQHYLQLGIVDSLIQKPFAISQLCHKVRNEIQIYQLAVALKQTWGHEILIINMNFMFKIFFSILISTLSVHLLWASNPVTQAILYENGTCTEEPLPKIPNQVINTNGTVDDFLKSLPSDNRVLAELLCQSD